ncbi:MAG: hypothetical protein ACRD2H_07670 [Terriglobales bacterium]
MKGPNLVLSAVVAALVMMCATRALAQEVEDAAVYGYTSIDYDSQSNQLTVYSETDANGGECGYYDPQVSVSLTDPNGGSAGSSLASGPPCGTAETSFGVTPQLSGTYNAAGDHFLTLDEYSSYCGGTGDSGCWVDYDGWEWWSDFALEEFAGYSFDDPFAGPQYTPDNPVILGESYDYVSDTITVPCGDDRDSIIAEYGQLHVPYQPTCTDFTNFSPDSRWSFAQLDSGYFADWAIIRGNLTTGLDSMNDKLSGNGLSVQLTSAYRDPQKEKDVDAQKGLHYYADSRHQMGDAADMATNASIWGNYHDAGKSAGACVEPEGESGSAHVHADWRVYDPPAWSACPVSKLYGPW